MMFLYNTAEKEELLVLCQVPNFPSSEIVALVPLNMAATEMGREEKLNQTYRKNFSAYCNYPVTKPALQWIIIDLALKNRVSSRFPGIHRHLGGAGELCRTATSLTSLAMTESCQDQPSALLPQNKPTITTRPPLSTRL